MLKKKGSEWRNTTWRWLVKGHGVEGRFASWGKKGCRRSLLSTVLQFVCIDEDDGLC